MFDNESLTSEILSNPGRLQHLVLQELSQRTDGENVPSDPNNGFFTALETSSSLVSHLYRNMIRNFESTYPARATTPEDLYKHMSDYDYTHMTANPASVSIKVLFDRDEIAERSEVFNADYKKLIIPKNTLFTIGDRTFGIFYPIEIRTNIRTGNVLVTYDTSESNPLHSLSTNLVKYQTFPMEGINVIALDIDTFQFNRQIYTETTTPQQGFNTSYAYTNRFMAARVFHRQNGVWNELAYTLSEDIYDRSRPTAKLAILSDIRRIRVNIPQIYFTQGLVGNEIRVQIFTTEGELNVPITTEDVSNMNVSYNTGEDQVDDFSAILNSLTYGHMYPNDHLILGGRNEISFENLKKRVIYSATFDQNPITPIDLQTYVEDNGFTLTKYLDNVTSRVYFANRKLVDSEGRSVPVTLGQINVTNDIIDQTSTILDHSDRSITILPTTIYQYTASSGVCQALSDTERSNLEALSKEELVEELNSNTYTRNPFHIVVYREDRYPVTKTFNLNVPSVENVLFVEENVQAIPQMTIASSDILHLVNNTGGFTIRLGITKVGMDDIARSDVTIVLSTTDRNGNVVYREAVFDQELPDIDVYTVPLPCLYRITQDGYIRMMMTHTGGVEAIADISLDSTFEVHFMVNPLAIPEAARDFTLPEVPSDFSDLTVLVYQRLSASFGRDLSSGIFNITDALWSEIQYATWPETVYHTHQEDVYELDEDGTILTTIVPNPDYDDQDPDSKPNLVQTNLLYAKGDPILDTEGAPLVKHNVGDTKYNEIVNDDGSITFVPIALKDREIVYFAESFMLDARLYASSGEEDISYLRNVPTEINAYVDLVETMYNALSDRTEIFFRPTRTIGSADFGLGNETTVNMSLSLGFSIVYYVTRAVNVDEALKDSMRRTTETIIESYMTRSKISLADISEELKNTLGDNIESVDSLGINGVPTVQTLFVKDADVSPMVGRRLAILQDGSFDLQRDITVEWRLAE